MLASTVAASWPKRMVQNFPVLWQYVSCRYVLKLIHLTKFLTLRRCNFDRLKAHQEELPVGSKFQGPYRNMWPKINKIIDGLHLQNHKQASCHELYNPNRFTEMHPHATKANTMAAEQFFSWLSKHVKQLNAIGKLNQQFFLHCIIQRRNDYVMECLQHGETPESVELRNPDEKYGLWLLTVTVC